MASCRKIGKRGKVRQRKTKTVMQAVRKQRIGKYGRSALTEKTAGRIGTALEMRHGGS